MELFTWQTLATLTGLSAATLLITNVLRVAMGVDARWIGLVVAVVLSGLVWAFASDGSADAAVLAIINSFAVYGCAIGGNQVVGALDAQRQPYHVTDRKFWRSWW